MQSFDLVYFFVCSYMDLLDIDIFHILFLSRDNIKIIVQLFGCLINKRISKIKSYIYII